MRLGNTGAFLATVGVSAGVGAGISAMVDKDHRDTVTKVGGITTLVGGGLTAALAVATKLTPNEGALVYGLLGVAALLGTMTVGSATLGALAVEKSTT